MEVSEAKQGDFTFDNRSFLFAPPAFDKERLHDINKTGFAQFIVLIPFLGILILIIWCVTEGEKKKNFYGPPIKFKK